MTSQLLLLLGKSWKTFYRSKGWLLTQCFITGILLLVSAGVMFFTSPKTKSTRSIGSDRIKCHAKHYFSFTKKHKCLVNRDVEMDPGQCGDDIKHSIRTILDTNFKHPCNESATYNISNPQKDEDGIWHRRSSESDFLMIRALSQSVVDVDLIAHSDHCKRENFKRASDQFYIPPWDGAAPARSHWEGCDVVPSFHFIAQHSGKINIHVSKSLKTVTYPSLLKEEITMYIYIALNMFPLFFFCLETSVEVTQESNTLIKDYLLSMGMSRLFYFLHHFIFNYLKAWVALMLSTAIVGGFAKSFGLYFFLVPLFSLALGSFVSISLMIGSLFKKPGTTVIVTIILWIALLVMTLVVKVDRTSGFSMLCSLNPLYALLLAFDSKRENDFRGAQIWFSEVSYAIPQGYYMLMLIFDAIFYYFLAVFMDLLGNSCENPLTMLIQLVRRNKNRDDEASKKSLLDNQEKSDVQSPAELILEGIHKVFSTGQHVVKGIDLRLHKGQVTALLGHNGAGKSTTFSMISGMTVPTSGRIIVNGTESIAERQQLIGFCPQYNPIFPKLTVAEHLNFFARLKGIESGSDKGDKVLNILGMSRHGGDMAANLSGGMKRKLCIAISMAADPPIVLLDEPTAGLDPGARRDFEKLLIEWKKEHAILLTTHYTDEAEMLADRIFIMAKGKIFCSGSAQYLRKKFDSGYVLSFAVQNESDVERASIELMKIVQEFLPNVSVYKSRGKQFGFKLSTDDTKRFVEMFRKIEEAGPSFGMQSYGLSLNQLEQVFLKVGEMTGTVDRKEEVQTALKELIQENDNRVHGPVKVLKQFGNILLKRLYFDIAHIMSLIFVLIGVAALSWFVIKISVVKTEDVTDVDRADVLFIKERYRIGVHPSLGDHSKIEHIAKQYGDYLTVDPTSNNISDWYKTESLKRPPIMGVLSRAGNDWTIYIESEAFLPTLEAIAARINNPSLEKVRYGVKQVSEGLVVQRSSAGQFPFTTCHRLVLILTAPFIVIRPLAFLIIEKLSNFAHQERLTGVNRVVFLFSSIFYDFLIFLLPFVTILGSAFAANPSEAANHLPQVIYLPLLIFASNELLVLIMYRLFASRAKGEISIIILVLFTGFITLSVNESKKGFIPESISYVYSPFYLFNPMLAASMWTHVLENADKERSKNADDDERRGSYYEPPPDHSNGRITGPFFIIVHFLMLILAFLNVEFRILKRCKKDKTDEPVQKSGNFPPKSDPNSPVQHGEPNAIAVHQPGNDFVLRVNNLQKSYDEFQAVKGISFGVRSHECFGVLGINGAGKSSTFEMLTGNALPDRGSASVGGVDCRAAPQIGYCPQADALMEDLTGRQSLIILAALHGYENPRKVADIVITCVGMQEHANKKLKRYSGGQRRKISVAASLLAQNSLIILDEPTAGIDPIARRDIWSVICALRESTDTAIVLTSHSMDEVEALVSNMIVMRAGSIVVEGSPQMIKNQYGDHYSFNLTVENGPKVGEITSHVLSVFPTASLHDSASLRNIKYRIPRHNGDVFSSIFEKAAAIAEKLNATDFCFTQATLEDAFMLAATASPLQNAAPAPSAKSVVTPGTPSPDPAMASASQPETASVPEPVQKTAKDETVSSTQSDDH